MPDHELVDRPVFEPTLCLLDPPVTSREHLLDLLAQRALAEGYVAEGFREALHQREATYPTGLPTPWPCAIPHVEAAHVHRPALAAVRLADAVEFGEMGGSDRIVSARFVVLLLVSDPHAQVPLLQALMVLLRDPDLESRIAGADGPGELAAVCNSLLSR